MKLNKKTVLGQLIVGGFLAMSMPAFAHNHASGAVEMQTITIPGKLVEVGTQDADPKHNEVVKGFANDLPLITVLRQLTPSGWIVKKSDSKDNPLDTDMMVSWSGGKNWVGTLSDLASTYNLQVVVNWGEKSITLMKSRTIQIPKPKEEPMLNVPKTSGLFQLAGMSDNSAPAPAVEPAKTPEVAPYQPVVTPAPKAVEAAPVEQQGFKDPELRDAKSVEERNAIIGRRAEAKDAAEKSVEPVAPVVQEVKPVAPVVKTWAKESHKSLKGNVEQWAAEAGYQLVWLGADYPIDMSAQFSGEFDAENGPIHQLSIDYGPDSRVEVPLSFKFYQNKTLVVENWAFEQSGFPQMLKR